MVLRHGSRKGMFVFIVIHTFVNYTVYCIPFSLTDIQTEGLIKGGATLNHLKRTSELLIMPNDGAYGLFEWSSMLFVTTEKNERNSSALLVVKRALGIYGTVMISYETVLAGKVGMKERAARPGIDFIAVRANVTVASGRDEAFVSIPIMHVSVYLEGFFYRRNLYKIFLSKKWLSSSYLAICRDFQR